MDQGIILELLEHIKMETLVGRASIEAVNYAMDKGLLERTPLGNFKLSQKGEDFLTGKITLESLNNAS